MVTELEEDKAGLSAANEAQLGVMLEAHKLAQKHAPDIAQKLHLMIGWSPVDLLEIRDLEQQAKGISDLKAKASEYLWSHNKLEIRSNSLVKLLTNFAVFYSAELSNQAKALKEGV